MDLEFDPDKDTANQSKHGVSLRRAVDLEIEVVIEDERFSSEPRYRAYGRIDKQVHCLAFAVRDGRVRAISLRRAHRKEYRRYVPTDFD